MEGVSGRGAAPPDPPYRRRFDGARHGAPEVARNASSVTGQGARAAGLCGPRDWWASGGGGGLPSMTLWAIYEPDCVVLGVQTVVFAQDFDVISLLKACEVS